MRAGPLSPAGPAPKETLMGECVQFIRNGAVVGQITESAGLALDRELIERMNETATEDAVTLEETAEEAETYVG